jgi:hypothetical protein
MQLVGDCQLKLLFGLSSLRVLIFKMENLVIGMMSDNYTYAVEGCEGLATKAFAS